MCDSSEGGAYGVNKTTHCNEMQGFALLWEPVFIIILWQNETNKQLILIIYRTYVLNVLYIANIII